MHLVVAVGAVGLDVAQHVGVDLRLAVEHGAQRCQVRLAVVGVDEGQILVEGAQGDELGIAVHSVEHLFGGAVAPGRYVPRLEHEVELDLLLHQHPACPDVFGAVEAGDDDAGHAPARVAQHLHREVEIVEPGVVGREVVDFGEVVEGVAGARVDAQQTLVGADVALVVDYAGTAEDGIVEDGYFPAGGLAQVREHEQGRLVVRRQRAVSVVEAEGGHGVVEDGVVALEQVGEAAVAVDELKAVALRLTAEIDGRQHQQRHKDGRHAADRIEPPRERLPPVDEPLFVDAAELAVAHQGEHGAVDPLLKLQVARGKAVGELQPAGIEHPEAGHALRLDEILRRALGAHECRARAVGHHQKPAHHVGLLTQVAEQTPAGQTAHERRVAHAHGAVGQLLEVDDGVGRIDHNDIVELEIGRAVVEHRVGRVVEDAARHQVDLAGGIALHDVGPRLKAQVVVHLQLAHHRLHKVDVEAAVVAVGVDVVERRKRTVTADGELCSAGASGGRSRKAQRP